MTPKLQGLLLAAALLWPIGQPAWAADFTLRFASIYVAGSQSYEQLITPFKQAVEQDSADRITVDAQGLGGFGKPAELFAMVERGDIEIAITVHGYNPGRFPRTSVMELPLMFDSAAQGTQALWKLYQEGRLDAEYASVKVLGLFVLPPYGIFTSGKPINQLRDLRGLRIRAHSPIVGAALARLGAIPVGMPLDMMGEMLAAGTINAITYGWDALTTARGGGGKSIMEMLNVLVDVNIAGPTLMVVMNRAAWDALPADLQEVVQTRSLAFMLANARLRDLAEAKARDRLRADQHFTYSVLAAEQRSELARSFGPVVDDWAAGLAKQGIDGAALHERARALTQQFISASR